MRAQVRLLFFLVGKNGGKASQSQVLPPAAGDLSLTATLVGGSLVSKPTK